MKETDMFWVEQVFSLSETLGWEELFASSFNDEPEIL